jgi:hypothetical protein
VAHISWRDRARTIIARVLKETAEKTEREIRVALFAAYPFGQRQYHPYKIWCDEIQRQRRFGKYTHGLPRPGKTAYQPPDPAQGELF